MNIIIMDAKESMRSSMLPIPVTRVLRKLGQDIRDARRPRRIPVASPSRMSACRSASGVREGKAAPQGS